MRVCAPLALALVVWAAAACGEKHFDPPDRAERIAVADSLFAEVGFDTITWASDSARAIEGNATYAASCRNCHGPLGRAGTAYAAERGLDVPSLVSADWRFAGQLDSVRHHVFVGHIHGMPTWGVAGLTPREIDAVSHYILDVLRPELLGGEGG